MKIAFSVTVPDLARVLADVARQAQSDAPRPPVHSTVSPAARRALDAKPEAADEQS